MKDLILASASRYRAKLLDDAGLSFGQIASDLDERAIEAPLAQADVLPEDRALILAEAKAVDVSEHHTGSLVIGCDQILSFQQQVLHKCKNMEEARRRLLLLSGTTHHLHSAVVIAENGQTLWRHVTTCAMKMRDLSPAFIGRHLSDVGEGVLGSVGAYQIEGRGIQLFDSMDGDMFSIIGLPLLPLLDQLRRLEAIDG
ncbi:MAG: Maf-like protein [Rhizobiaceae bacterium]|nr:Maf-like protein [Rhizobiaceae bacterium]